MWKDQNGTEVLGNKTIVVDALNYLCTFFPITRSVVRPLEAIELMEERVAQATAAARGADLTLIWVFDNGQATDEARDKCSVIITFAK